MKWLKFLRWNDCNTGNADTDNNNDIVENFEHDCGDNNFVGVGEHNDEITDGVDDGLDISSKRNERNERDTKLDRDDNDRDDRDDGNAHANDTDRDDSDRDDDGRDDCTDLDSERSNGFDDSNDSNDDRSDTDWLNREHDVDNDDGNDLDDDRGDSFGDFDGFDCL